MMPFPVKCACDHYCGGLKHRVREAGSGAFHGMPLSSYEIENADTGMLRKLEPEEKVDGLVDYDDFEAVGRLPAEDLSTIPVGDTREDEEDGRILGDNHCARHRTMEPAKEVLQTQLVRLSQPYQIQTEEHRCLLCDR
jgi:hypothetical protein